jgi:muramoyltetrapeptide carboxypeptidase
MKSCALISPAFHSSEGEIINAKRNIIKLGFNEVEDFTSKKIFFNKWSGDDKERLNLLYQAWNSTSSVIMCCRGGSGVSHIINKIDLKRLIGKKILIGYSDISMLLYFVNSELNLISLHGPNALKKLDKKSLMSLKDALQMKDYGISFNKDQIINDHPKIISEKIIGGNLERTLEYLDYYDLDLKDKILFLEETGESEHKIYNFLIKLRDYPNFKPKAILFGNLGVKNKDLMREMVKSIFPNIPIIMDLPFGHCVPNITIPLGANCTIDFNGRLKFSFPLKDHSYAIKF